MKKLRVFFALLLCLALVAAPMTVLADGEDTVTLNLSNGPAATGDAIRPVMAMMVVSAMALLGMAVAQKRFSL